MDDSGQAFPVPISTLKEERGMTIRNYYMAHAPEMPEWFKEWRNHYTIERAYFDWRLYYADALLAERKKEK